MVVNHSRIAGVTGSFFRSFLFLSLYGFSASLLLGRGTYVLFLYASAVSIFVLLFYSQYRRELSPPVLLGLGLIVLLFGQGYLAADGMMATGHHRHLLWAAVPLMGVTLLPGHYSDHRALNHNTMIPVLACLYVILQWLACWLKLNKFGLFPNLHYLALYSLLTLPVLWYFSVKTQGPSRWILVMALLGNLALLLKTQSRPGYLALIAGAAVAVPFLSPRVRWITAAAIVLVPIALYCSGIYGFDLRVDDLFGNLSREERATIWKETTFMQFASSNPEWWFGHGIDTYFRDYQPYSSFPAPKKDLASPHNFVLELLYSHGLVGLVLVMLAYVAWYTKVIAVIRTATDPFRKQIGILFISLMTAHFIHAFLTLPFFSRYTLYPLSLILGASLVFCRDHTVHE